MCRRYPNLHQAVSCGQRIHPSRGQPRHVGGGVVDQHRHRSVIHDDGQRDSMPCTYGGGETEQAALGRCRDSVTQHIRTTPRRCAVGFHRYGVNPQSDCTAVYWSVHCPDVTHSFAFEGHGERCPDAAGRIRREQVQVLLVRDQ
eukprot:PhF_6_TR36301/c1_g1_i3/m.52996